MKRTPLAIALSAAALTACTPAVTAATAGAALDWKPCGTAFPDPREPFPADAVCARVRVPLDHADPGSGTIEIAVAKLPARPSGEGRIGTLFLNPGGPGDSGVDLVRDADRIRRWDPALRDRFDVVAMDPRGVGRSTPVRCPLPQGDAPLFPYRAAQEPGYLAATAAYTEDCGRRAGRLLDHVSTADAARDLDLLRRAVGDRRITYQGGSYGTYLGMVYANLFPGRVRAMALSAVVDPARWAGDQLTRVEDQARSAENVLRRFTRECRRAGDRCALNRTPGDLDARVTALYDRLREGPVQVRFATPEGVRVVPVTYDVAVMDLARGMYWPRNWTVTAAYLAALETAASGRPNDPLPGQPSAEVADYNWAANHAVTCADTTAPRDPRQWTRRAPALDRQAPIFGRYFLYGGTLPCATWPGRAAARYPGPFDRRTSGPILLVNNRHDPATPHHGAVRAARLLARAHLVTVNGYGHDTRVPCVLRLEAAHLTTGRPPRPGTTCTAPGPFG